MRDLKQDFLDNSRLSSRDLYGKRQGRKLKDRQAALVDTLLPQLSVPLDIARQVDPARWFTEAKGFTETQGFTEAGEVVPGGVSGRATAAERTATPADRSGRPTCLEIGFGGGEHLYAWSGLRPDWNFIGVEYYVNGVAKLLSELDREPRDNLLIHHGDGRDLIDGLTDACLTMLFVLQPDPWPKKRHHGRRIIRPDNLRAFHRVLAPGGLLRISTDHQGYLPWILREMLAARALFSWTAGSADDWRTRPERWPDSRYAAKARAEGRPVTYLEYRKVA